LILSRLRQDGELEDSISPNFLLRNWPPAFKEWSTRGVRDAFFASPLFPRLSRPDAIKETIIKGVREKLLAYVGKGSDGRYLPFEFGGELPAADVELTEDVYIISREVAEAYLKSLEQPKPEPPQHVAEPQPGALVTDGGEMKTPEGTGKDTPPGKPISPRPVSAKTHLIWSGEVPHQKYTSFYMKVLSKFAAGKSLKIRISVDVNEEGGISEQKVEETRAALRELGLGEDIGLD
jgi:hypothetical protein